MPRKNDIKTTTPVAKMIKKKETEKTNLTAKQVKPTKVIQKTTGLTDQDYMNEVKDILATKEPNFVKLAFLKGLYSRIKHTDYDMLMATKKAVEKAIEKVETAEIKNVVNTLKKGNKMSKN